jgi:DNA-binding response OmpR family regulator
MNPIRFGPLFLHLDQRRVFRDGTDLKLRPLAVRVLRVLLQKARQIGLLLLPHRRYHFSELRAEDDSCRHHRPQGD